MTPVQILQLIIREIAKEKCSIAVCGGIAASIYRSDMRTTNDVDIALAIPHESGAKKERELAINLLERLKIETSLGWIPNIATADESNVFLIVGKLGKNLPNVDFLLPNLPWVRNAVERAQKNLIDYGFEKIPTLTPEDLIISKAFALNNDPNRLQDRLDIESIISTNKTLDNQYLETSLKALGLSS